MESACPARPTMRPVFEHLEQRLLLSGAIEGTVWEDLNANGLRELGDAGMNGWTVELVDYDTETTVATAVTATATARSTR